MPISESHHLAGKALAAYWQAVAEDPEEAAIHLYGSGPVAKLEDQLKQHYGKAFAVCMSNATTGLWALALALGLTDCEVITTPLTYGATLSGWLKQGNHPIFADIDPTLFTLDPDSVRQHITTKTAAILAVDIFGNPADMQSLREIADEYGLWFFADAAQSLGAYRDGIPASSLAHALVVSFTLGKSLFAGEGGAVLTDDQDLYERLIWHTQHPYRQKRELGLGFVNELGLNGRIHPLAAVIGDATFAASLRQVKDHQQRCLKVIDGLNEIGLTMPLALPGIEPAFFRLVARWRSECQQKVLVERLKEMDIVVEIRADELQEIYSQIGFQSQYGVPKSDLDLSWIKDCFEIQLNNEKIESFVATKKIH